MVAQQEKHVAGLSRGHVHAAADDGLRGINEIIRNSQNHAMSSVKPPKAVSGTKVIWFEKLRDYVLLVLKLRDRFYTLNI